jgi:predicted DNA-binding transcriptional regulator YafY
MPRKKETITLSIPPGTKEQLEAIADRLGIRWGKSPSISGLLVAIAQQQVEVSEPFTLSANRVEALQQAIKALIDTGHIDKAQITLTLLLEYGNLEMPLRQSLLAQISQPTEAWRKTLDRYIDNHQPFHLLYRSKQDEQELFTVCYGEINPIEKRLYLEAWCQEANDRADIPELKHNRCFRLDGILNCFEAEGDWRDEGLDEIKVHLHFYRGMVKAYESRERDLSNEVVGDVRQVVRRVSNPFWLLREVRRYGGDCAIVAPERLRQLRRQELLAECQLYDRNVTDPL